MELVLATLSGLMFPLILILAKTHLIQKAKNRELEKKLEERQSEETKMIADGVCLLIRINIIDYHKRYMREGCIPLYALENVKTLYSVYSVFGENGVHNLMEELGDLPVRN